MWYWWMKQYYVYGRFIPCLIRLIRRSVIVTCIMTKISSINILSSHAAHSHVLHYMCPGSVGIKFSWDHLLVPCWKIVLFVFIVIWGNICFTTNTETSFRHGVNVPTKTGALLDRISSFILSLHHISPTVSSHFSMKVQPVRVVLWHLKKERDHELSRSYFTGIGIIVFFNFTIHAHTEPSNMVASYYINSNMLILHTVEMETENTDVYRHSHVLSLY